MIVSTWRRCCQPSPFSFCTIFLDRICARGQDSTRIDLPPMDSILVDILSQLEGECQNPRREQVWYVIDGYYNTYAKLWTVTEVWGWLECYWAITTVHIRRYRCKGNKQERNNNGYVMNYGVYDMDDTGCCCCWCYCVQTMMMDDEDTCDIDDKKGGIN